jgi:17beta-estradiol 17-dehydrogenase / very-long-chain 3-oxoacyl-CoA reductase
LTAFIGVEYLLALVLNIFRQVDKFAESLNVEYASSGVHVQVQNPLYVTSKLSKMRKSLTVPTPAAYARCAVNAIGFESQTSPFFLHAAQLWLMDLLPTSLLNSQVMAMHKSIRKRAMKKLEAGAEGQKSK